MFDKISERRFQHLAGDFVDVRNKLNRLFDKTTETPSEVIRLRTRVSDLENDNIRTTIDNERKVNNLIEVIRAIVKPSELKKVIAVGDDDTEITVGDILDANGLVPECEPEDVPTETQDEDQKSDGPVNGEVAMERSPEESEPENGLKLFMGEPGQESTEGSTENNQISTENNQIY